MPTAEFENWWAEIQRHPGGLRATEAHATARRISRRLRALTNADHSEFVDQLMQVLLERHHAYGVALFLLEGISDPAVLDMIARHLQPLPGRQCDDEEAHLADLIRVLAAANDASLMPVARDYLLQREIVPGWATVPWALWPHNKELFGDAWARFFRERDPAEWTSTLIIKSFLTEPDAISVVRKRFDGGSGRHWAALRDALLRQAGLVGWLSAEQRAELEQLL